MLLDAINDMCLKFKGKLDPISTGASAGLFEILGDNKPEELVKEVRKWLRSDNLYRNATFVVNIAQGEFRQANEQVIAANRWQQMQSLSFATAGLQASEAICKTDEVRPASPRGPEDPKNSLSVQCRRKHGRDQKQAFYQRLLGDHAPQAFTSEFESLAKNINNSLVPTQNLNGKMAVFYADGNSFGKIGSACKTPDDLKRWDTYIKAQRKELLDKVLQLAQSDPRWQTQTGIETQIRLETLLWGGDELMFVVPGWCGMALANLFFEQTAGQMSYPVNGKDKPLTHACGLVFCHHQAPISAISQLAKALADKSKEDISAFKGKDSLNWLVLESFDQAGSDLDAFLQMRFRGKIASWDTLTLSPTAVNALACKLSAQEPSSLKVALPRSTMVRALRMIVQGDALDTGTEASEALRLLQRSYTSVNNALKPSSESAEGHTEVFNQLWAQLHPKGSARDWHTIASLQPDPDDLAAWVKLIELWDYCQNPAQTTQATQEVQA
ncbi:hypothetical protein [Propionivibrio sp.]|uniref:hypothetical protein n=1 Tax=Propionivibrio sp. TaxID=2212460 RepID=UPI003BEFE229